MKKIAVIDDNDDVLFTIKYGATKVDTDIQIDTYNNPNDFIEESTKSKYDLILLDIMMPQKDGWDTFAEIKSGDSVNKDTPVIFLTAKTDNQSRKLGSLGASDYITKPFYVPDLLEKIKKFI